MKDTELIASPFLFLSSPCQNKDLLLPVLSENHRII